MNGSISRQNLFSFFLTLMFAMASTTVTAQQIMAVLQDNEVWGHSWTDGESIEVRIGEPGDWAYTANTWAGSGGNWIIDTDPFDIQPGQTVQVEGETITREHVVYYLTVTKIDPVADLVSGTADPLSEVRVTIAGEDVRRYVTADTKGEWSADFATPSGKDHQDRAFNIEAGAFGFVEQFDSHGHSTQLRWHLPPPPQPFFNVDPQRNHLWGHEWPADDTVTIKRGDPAQIIGTADTDQWGNFWLDSLGDIQSGELWQVECGDILKTHVVTELTVTVVNPDNDTVSGTAVPESWVSVHVYGANVHRHVEADEYGDWIADFSVDVGPEPWDDAYDIRAGDEGNARQEDEDRDSTFVNWRIEQPRFTVSPQHNNIWGHEWPVGAELTVTIGNPDDPDWEDSVHANEWGDFHLDVWGFDIQPGNLVAVSDGVTTKEHIVTSLTITEVNPDEDTVSGTAAPDSWVHVWVHDEHVYRDVQANEHGVWKADFSVDAGGHGGGTYNLDAGSDGGAGQRDEDGDETLVNWYVADPVIVVELFYNNIRGRGWPSGAEVVVTIGDPEAPIHVETVHADGRGDWRVRLYDEEHLLQTGDMITADDGTYLRSMTVANLSVTGADADADTLSGTGPANAYVLVRVGEVTIEAQANDDGEWTADLGAQGVELQEGTEGELFFYDEQGNSTQTRWRYATLDIEELSMIKLSAEEEGWHIFGLDIMADGLIGARFQAPSGEWYTVVYDWDDWWVFNQFSSSMDELDAEFTPGEYLLELTHYHGVTEVTLELSADMEMPNATPVVTAPEEHRSDVDPIDVEIIWESVADPNFNAIFVGVEDEIFGWEEEEEWYEAFLPIENGMPTQHTIGELKPNRIYLADVAFINMDEKLTGGDLGVEYAVMLATLGGTAFSTNTDETLFDPIQRVDISRFNEGGDEWLFEFEIEFSEALQVPGESPLYYRIGLWMPQDEGYTLFDSSQQNEAGPLVEFEIVRDELDDLPGSGWYALIVQKDNESAVATWFLFAEPESEDPLPMPEQTPVITQPQPDAVLANPVTFSWEPVTDENVNAVGVFHTPYGFALLETDAVEYSPPEDLPVGQNFVRVGFGTAYLDMINADAIPYGITQGRNADVEFTVGYTLFYEAGPGGWLVGPAVQVVAPGGSGEEVTAFSERGALFVHWCDGHANAVRTDDGVHGDITVTAKFSSAGGVPIDWYDDNDLAPEEDETWADLDKKDLHNKGLTLEQEFVANTDPNNPESLFLIGEVDRGPPFRISFVPSSPERMYTLQYTEDLMSDEWEDVEGQGPREGTGTDDDFMEDEGAEALRFYRIKVELP